MGAYGRGLRHSHEVGDEGHAAQRAEQRLDAHVCAIVQAHQLLRAGRGLHNCTIIHTVNKRARAHASTETRLGRTEELPGEEGGGEQRAVGLVHQRETAAEQPGGGGRGGQRLGLAQTLDKHCTVNCCQYFTSLWVIV